MSKDIDLEFNHNFNGGYLENFPKNKEINLIDSEYKSYIEKLLRLIKEKKDFINYINFRI